ncbi:MAG: hypothetical protein ABUL46_01140, partial [Chitinophaga rupis]
ALSIIVGALRFRSLQPKPVRWLVPFLCATLVAEVAGLIMVRMSIQDLWIFNLFTCGEFIFYSFFYLNILENQRVKKIIRYAMGVYPLLFLINIFWIEGFYRFHTITYRIGSVMIVVWAYLYFRQLMRSSSYSPVLRNPIFWISTGLLFFYTGFFFYMTAFNILLKAKVSTNAYVWYIISDTLNALLYTCFLISFVCQMNITNRSLR